MRESLLAVLAIPVVLVLGIASQLDASSTVPTHRPIFIVEKAEVEPNKVELSDLGLWFLDGSNTSRESQKSTVKQPTAVATPTQSVLEQVGQPASMSMDRLKISGEVYRYQVDPNQLVDMGTHWSYRIIPQEGKIAWIDDLDLVKPGQRGASMLAAHVTDVFAPASGAKVGDIVTVQDSTGQQLKFKVNLQPKPISKLDEPIKYAKAHSSGRTLWLVSCYGEEFFTDGQLSGHRTKNVLVRAEYTGFEPPAE